MPSRKLSATHKAYAAARLAESDTGVQELLAQNLRYTAAYYRRLACLGSERYRHHAYRSFVAVNAVGWWNAVARGGTVLVTAHLGDFDLAGSWIAHESGKEPIVLTAGLRFHGQQTFFDGLRRAGGMAVRHRDQTSFEDLVRELRAGQIVIVALDRASKMRTVDVDFLGRPAQMSVLPALLASRTGAQVLTASTFTAEDGHRELTFGPPHTLPGIAARRAAHRSLIECCSAELGVAIRRAAHQWHVPADLGQLPWDPGLA